MRRIYTLLTLFFSLLCLHAQSFMFKHLEVSDGLSNNSVRCIYKDSEGLMWFGTMAGLNYLTAIHSKCLRVRRIIRILFLIIISRIL